MTCSTFVNPESSITHTRLPQMKASPLIRLYFDILSNEILKKGLAQADRSLFIMLEFSYWNLPNLSLVKTATLFYLSKRHCHTHCDVSAQTERQTLRFLLLCGFL